MMIPELQSIPILIVSILNIPPTIIAILVNTVCLVTLIRTRSLHTPSNILLGALCVSDLLVGLLAQPFCLVFLFLLYDGNKNYCIWREICVVLYRQCAGLSFLFLSLMSIDRCIAVCYPFKYQRFATCKRYAYLSVTIGAVCIVLSCLPLIPRFQEQFEFFYGISQILAVCCILISYAKIYRIIRRQNNRVFAVGNILDQNARSGQGTKRQRKSVYTTAIIIGLFLTAYLPHVIFSLYRIAKHYRLCDVLHTLFNVELWTDLLVLVNSCINPLIYCLRCTDIRNAILKMLRRGVVTD